jgi:hypothetical protein
VPRDRVNVEVERGHVTLTGTVDRPYSKACAERDAREPPRVTGVTNAIVVGGSEATLVPRSCASGAGSVRCAHPGSTASKGL